MDPHRIPHGIPIGGILDPINGNWDPPLDCRGSIGAKVVRRDSAGIPTGYPWGACGNITGCLWASQKIGVARTTTKLCINCS